jgi:predicted ATPase
MSIFSEITLEHWRQFNNIAINLDKRMTVLTGENGTGKTTILNILSRHFGWNIQLISTQLPVSKRHRARIWSDVWERINADLEVKPGSYKVGNIVYNSGQTCQLMAPPDLTQAQYNLTYKNQQPVIGLHIPSHRPSFSYHRITNIPTEPKTSQEQYQQYQNILLNFFQSDTVKNPWVALKQSLISLAVFGYDSEAVMANPEYRRIFEEYQEILRILLPKVLGFKKLEVRLPDIVFVTETGDFSIDAASGGVGALVSIAWQIFMYGQDKDEFVVTFDEPESHLHPSMQRELLPNLLRAFPRTQFIISTHSPFIVTSSPTAKVYALTFSEIRRVDSLPLEAVNLSGTADETLREILGVPISVPIWVEERLQEILNRYQDQELTISKLQDLKKDLIDSDLRALLPDAISYLKGDNA